MRAFLIFVALVIVSVAGEVTDFKEWKEKQGKDYSKPDEKSEAEAEEAFKKNVELINKHNSDPNVSYKLGVNDATDKTKGERVHRRGMKPNNKNVKSAAFSQRVKGTLPASLDYSSLVGPIKNQGQCGSCWAFAATAVMEYWSNCNKTNQLYSEQNLVDCDTNSAGCDGGHPLYAFVYSYSGMSDGRKYLYAAKEQQCQRKKYPPIYKFDMACGDSTDGDEKRLMSILATYGPVTTAIDSTGDEKFEFYKSGVFKSKKCSSKEADHAVTIVGYGTDKTQGDYWIVRNSWGTTWGEKGYFRIARGSNMCGIANEVFGLCYGKCAGK